MSLKTTEEGKLLRRLIHAKGGTRHAIESYNYFVEHRLRKIIESTPIVIANPHTGENFYIRFTNPVWSKPMVMNLKNEEEPLYPSDARLSKFSYMAKLYCSVGIYRLNQQGGYELRPGGENNIFTFLGKIPAMLHSSLCHLGNMSDEERFEKEESRKDAGAYFINKGVEKVILNNIYLRNNYPLMYEHEKDILVRYTCQTLNKSSIVSIYEKIMGQSSRTDVPNSIHVSFSMLGMEEGNTKKPKSMNIFRVFYIMLSMIISPQEDLIEKIVKAAVGMMIPYIIDEDKKREARRRREFEYYMKLTEKAFFAENSECGDVMSCAARVFKGIKNHDYSVLTNEKDRDQYIQKFFLDHMFINIPYDPNNYRDAILYKLRMMSMMIVKFVDHKNGYTKMDDRDSWAYKRIVNAGLRMEMLFIRIWKRILDDLTNKLGDLKSAGQVANAMNKKLLEEEFCKTFSKGVYPLTKDTETTIIDTLQRNNFLSAKSHVSRTTIPGNKANTVHKKRQLPESAWGMICPVMTPEGEPCGLVMDFAQTTFVSLDRETNTIFKVLITTKGPHFSYEVDEKRGRIHPLIVDGVNYGFCNPIEVRNILLEARRKQEINFDTAIIMDSYKFIWVYTNSGRLCRPLLVVNQKTRQLVIDEKNLRNETIRTMMDKGAIEYVDAAEQLQESTYIAYSVKKLEDTRKALALDNTAGHKFFTHCEIDPSSILGMSASIIPFPEFIQGPRNTYEASMGRQAMASDSIRVNNRFDKTVYLLREPGIPIVSTDAYETHDLDTYPAGQHAMMAIAIYTSDTQEDAIVFDRGAKERGAFRYEVHHSVTSIIKQVNKCTIKLAVPEHPQSKAYKYRHLNHDYPVIRVGSYVKSGDCLVGLVLVDQRGDKEELKDVSSYVEINKEGVVTNVVKTTDEEGSDMYRIHIRAIYDVETGDKFASRYSQKGTIGKILDTVDMPQVIPSSNSKNMAGIVPSIIFNPHGFPSRMTEGKKFEIMATKVAGMTTKRYNATPFRRFDWKGLKEELVAAGFKSNGKERMIHGPTGREMEAEILVGMCYYQLLRHLVRFKMQARGTGPIQLLTRQPLNGIRKEGGLKLGEMERDAILGHGASYLIHERMLYSSDRYVTPVCRKCGMIATSNELLNEISCKRCKGASFGTIEIPYILKLITQTLGGANIQVSFKTKDKTD